MEPQHGEKVYDVAIWLKPEDDEVVVLGPDGEAVAEEAEEDRMRRQRQQMDFLATMTFAGGPREPSCYCCA